MTDQTYALDMAFHQANTLAQNCQHADALEAWEKAIELGPDNPIAHHAHGFELSQLGRPDEALAALDRALELNPYSTMTSFLRVAVLATLGRRDEAISSFDQIPEPGHLDAIESATKAAAVAQLGWLDDALDSLEDAFAADFDSWAILEQDPHFAPMHEDAEYAARLNQLIERYRGSDAETSQQDRPAKFNVSGDEDRLEQVEARQIEDALEEGRPIDLQHVKVNGHVRFTGASNSTFRCLDTHFEALTLDDSTFTGAVIFIQVTCTGETSFKRANFCDTLKLLHARFSQGVDFSNAHFEKEASLSDLEFSSDADFSGSEFDRDVSFNKVNFGGSVSFRSTHFSGVRFHKTKFVAEVDFEQATFRRRASFVFSVWPAAASFKDARFEQKADFGFTHFDNAANFRSATFCRGANFHSTQFTGTADFMYAKFGQEEQGRRNPAIKDQAYFSDVTFAQSAVFVESKFYCEAQFTRVKFFGEADYVLSIFEEDARFPAAVFREKANFQHAYFSRLAGFPVVDFQDEVNFSIATFDGPVTFTGSTMRGKSRFTGCVYPADSEVNFSGVTGFAQMLVEWQYNPSYDETPENPVSKKDKLRRGLKGRLQFDEVFYIALVKNLREMGWLRNSDQVQFTYRCERRKRTDLLHRTVEFLFLELTFGYGTRPYRLLANFVLAGLFFALVYAGFVSDPATGTSILNYTNLNAHALPGMSWAFLHSLDVQTPGIDLNSLDDPLLSRGILRFDSEVSTVLAAQRVQQLLGWYFLALFLVLFNRLWMR